MIEQIIEEIRYVCETAPITFVSMGLIGVCAIGTVALGYSLIKHPIESMKEDANLGGEDYIILRELKELGILKEEEDRFFINKKSLTPYDLERLAEE